MFPQSNPQMCCLDVKVYFESLTEREKLYAYWMSRASFHGARILLRQVSPESGLIFDLLMGIHEARGDWKLLQNEAKIDVQELRWFLDYASQFLDGLGNYSSSGNSKFIPQLERSSFARVAACNENCTRLFDLVSEIMYDLQVRTLGFPGRVSQSTYYPHSRDMGEVEIRRVQTILDAHGIAAENTKLEKTAESYSLLIASRDIPDPSCDSIFDIATATTLRALAGERISLRFQDHDREMKLIITDIENAWAYTADKTQYAFLIEYLESFQSGSIGVHKRALEHWMEDKNPVVETILGFTESYRDPLGMRAEWRDFVAIQDQFQSERFAKIVKEASALIRKLPWVPKNGGTFGPFESSAFNAPSYTSRQVLTFVSSAIPASSTLPNYTDVVERCGVKNLTFENRINARNPAIDYAFLHPHDNSLCKEHYSCAFGALVVFHELVGHGTGKLLTEVAPNEFNFHPEDLNDSPVDGNKITTWYKNGETWKKIFGTSYEECRCELVALYFVADPANLEILGIGLDDDGQNFITASEVSYLCFLVMVRMGLVALQYWDPQSRTWGDSHARARYAIMKCLLREAPDLLTIAFTDTSRSDILITLQREHIPTLAMQVVNKYLLRLHIYRCTADKEAGVSMYAKMTEVDDEMASLREVVLAKREPSKQIVQPNIILHDTGTTQVSKECCRVGQNAILE